jgi:hypothetical protein
VRSCRHHRIPPARPAGSSLGQCAGPEPARTKKAGYLPALFSFLAARFYFSGFSGFFFSCFFWSMPLLMAKPLGWWM